MYRKRHRDAIFFISRDFQPYFLPPSLLPTAHPHSRLAQPNEDEQRHVHHDDQAPEQHTKGRYDDMIPHRSVHVATTARAALRSRPGTASLCCAIPAPCPNSHIPIPTSEPDKRRARKRQDHAERDLARLQRGRDTIFADCPGHHNRRHDANAAGHQPAHPRPHSPAQLPFANHLPSDGAYYTRGCAGQQESEREDGTRKGRQTLREERVDVEQGGIVGIGGAEQRCSGHDKDGAVDEQGEGEEADGELGD